MDSFKKPKIDQSADFLSTVFLHKLSSLCFRKKKNVGTKINIKISISSFYFKLKLEKNVSFRKIKTNRI